MVNFLILEVLLEALTLNHIPSTQQRTELSHMSRDIQGRGNGYSDSNWDPVRSPNGGEDVFTKLEINPKGERSSRFLRSCYVSSFSPVLSQLSIALTLCSNNLPDLMTTPYKTRRYLCCKGVGTGNVPLKSPHLQKASCSACVY